MFNLIDSELLYPARNWLRVHERYQPRHHHPCLWRQPVSIGKHNMKTGFHMPLESFNGISRPKVTLQG